MEETRRYRVLPGPESGTLRFLDRETYEPSVVLTGGDEGEAGVPDLHPGYLVDAVLDWSTSRPTVDSFEVVRPTLYAFSDRAEPIFEAARETWDAAQAAGDGMNVQVVHNTDNRPVGVVYVFAESGERGRFEEFRDGARPLEPLVDKLNDREGDDPREVFVLRPPDGAFTVVTLVMRKGGQLADTMRDTYEISRPAEPLDDA